MRSRVVVLGALVVIIVVLIWNVLIFSPKGRALKTAQQKTQLSQSLEQQLRLNLDGLQKIAKNGPEIAAQLDRLSAAVPTAPDLDGFILSANQIAVQSGIDWLSVAPSVVQAGSDGTSVIPLSIQIKGGFFQVLDYLNRLEAMGRLVIVDTINVSAGQAAASQSGPPALSVTLTARMFTRAQPAPPAGSAPALGSVGGTANSSTPPASGNSSGATSTTAEVN